MENSNDVLKKMVDLNNLIRQNQKEENIIKTNKIFKCPYFDIPCCDAPELKENNNKNCECFKYKLKYN